MSICLAFLAGCGGDDSHDTVANDTAANATTSTTTTTTVSTGTTTGTGTTTAVVPAAPGNLVATAGNAAVTLQWSAVSPATSYNVKRGTASGGPYTQLAAATSASFTDSSTANGTTYYYVVSALDAAGESANSAQASATPAAPSSTSTTLAAPTGLKASAGNAQVALTWTASSGATSYAVMRATSSGGPYSQVATPTSNSYTDSSLTNGTTYYYVVSAVDASSDSGNSSQVSALPTAPAAVTLAAPTGLAATAGSSNVNLNWSAISGATSYHVKRSTTSGGPYSQVAAPTSANYVDASVSNGTTYYYVVSALNASGESANSTQISATPAASTGSPSNACGMQLGDTPVIFCDTFDAPAATAGVRSGALDTNVWGVSRSQDTNFGQQWYNLWNPTVIQKCDGTSPTVLPPNDIIICNGQLREASNDNNSGGFDAGDVTSLAMYPKQPFDFAGRIGTVSFDVSNDAGPHGAWPEFWLSDLPVPDPFNHFNAWESLPANGLGIRFDGVGAVGDQGTCPTADNIDKIRWTVESAAAVRNYILDDTLGYGTRSAMNVTTLGCVIESSGPGNMNHIELRISQNQIDVYATDAGVVATPATLKHIAVITNANLSLTRGLIWMEDVHYNGDKILDPTRASQRVHTFSWDNVAFDGPFTDRDFAYDAPDNNLSVSNGAVSLGEFSAPNQTSTWHVAGLPANPNPKEVRVVFNFNGATGPLPSVLHLVVNGHAHSSPWPYPDTDTATTRTFAMTIPVTDLVTGTNVVQLGADQYEAFFNVSIVLAGVPGGVPVLPGSNNAYPGS